MWSDVLVVLLLLLNVLSSLTECKTLDDYISHYETLNYNPVTLHEKHLRAKRSLTDPSLDLHFRAFKRNFHLELKQDNTIFHKDHVLEHNGKIEKVDTSFIYSGKVKDVPNSFVHGAIINGTFRGQIDIPGSPIFYIEAMDRFQKNPRHHSVIYSEQHLNVDPYRHKREAESYGSCGNSHFHDWMTSIAESAVPSSGKEKRSADVHSEHESLHNIYSQEANLGGTPGRRSKRSYIGTQNTCTLYIRSDPLLWDYFNVELNYDAYRSKDEILALFSSHVTEIKRIYVNTNFETYDGPTSYSGVRFTVQRTKVMTDVSEGCRTANPKEYCNRNIDVTNFLTLNSKEDHSEFCLAYVFTYRDFIKGTLGLAWVGSATTAGGICEPYKEYTERGTQVSKSLNTGVITLINYAKRVPPKVSQLTFAHEVGHNFGSPHDDGQLCSPFGTSEVGGDKGNYIMFASATPGTRNHNDQFSPCSKDNITRVLEAVINNVKGKQNCFKASDEAFCGNSLVEDKEECDCGFLEDCQGVDNCCYPKGDPSGKECKLKDSVACSPSQGQCCRTTCNFVPSVDQLECKKKTECSQQSNCSGNSAICPPPEPQSNDTACNENSQLCQNGECTRTICKKMGPAWDECFLVAPVNDKNFNRETLCYVSCMNPNVQGGVCISSKDKDMVDASPDFTKMLTEISNNLPIQLPAGSPCDNFRGYCDVFHRCRKVDAEGPLARLKNLIFNPETLESIREWIVSKWWAVLLMCIGLVGMMALFIKVCAVHTPSSNPNKTPARKISIRQQNNRNQRRENNPQQQPPRQQGPPPPYPGEPSGGPPRGRGQRQGDQGRHKGKGKNYRQEMEMGRVV